MAMSPLAGAVYDLLRQRTELPEPRITYAELAAELRALSDEFEHVHHRTPPLYAALNEVGQECRRLRLPPLPALVVRADTRRPGEAYYAAGLAYRGERAAAWRRDLEAVKQASYPPRS
jgi:hypothetical protein